MKRPAEPTKTLREAAIHAVSRRKEVYVCFEEHAEARSKVHRKTLLLRLVANRPGIDLEGAFKKSMGKMEGFKTQRGDIG